ncbi:MAG: 2Fe-2S iron-sulfur cluster-binding protein, partial [Candidatus Limnocylindria bacterium]
MQLTINGERVSVEERPGESLLQLLREQRGLRSLKDGCAPEGSCGACTGIVDGRAVVSCAQPASRFADREVLTLEGLSADHRADWADAFVRGGASQCGFCSPGIVMKAEVLLGRTPEPTRDEIARALAGNLCRCTGYTKVIDAIEEVAVRRRGVPPAPAEVGPGAVGGRVPKYAGEAQVLGQQPFVADLILPHMLHAALRFSDHPRATVLRIDTAAAEAHPGVVRVVTWRDVPGERFCGLIERDWPPFVAEGEETRYVGDVLAAVAAETRSAAREAAELVHVEYEVLPPL